MTCEKINVCLTILSHHNLCRLNQIKKTHVVIYTALTWAERPKRDGVRINEMKRIRYINDSMISSDGDYRKRGLQWAMNGWTTTTTVSILCFNSKNHKSTIHLSSLANRDHDSRGRTQHPHQTDIIAWIVQHLKLYAMLTLQLVFQCSTHTHTQTQQKSVKFWRFSMNWWCNFAHLLAYYIIL